LLRGGEIGLATLNIAVSNVLGLLMVYTGYVLAKAL
jgi:fluoride ion exporter CrcB/FEX